MSNELTDVRCPCGAEFQADSYDAGFIAGSGMCQNCDAALPPKDICTCPSGDGSLRHPCPAHPAPVEQAGGDERVVDGKPRATKCPDCGEGDLMPGDLCACGYETDPAAGYACSECDGSGEGCVGEVCRECDGSGWFVTPEQARAALAQHSPAPTLRAAIDIANDRFEAPVAKWGTDLAGEEERPEIEEVSEFEREDIARSAFETAMADGISLDSFLSLSNTLAARYERIVGALRFERQQMDRAFTACINERDAANARLHEVATACATAEQERDAALARVAELEAKLSDPTAVHQWQFSNAWFDGSEEVVLKAGKEGSPIRTLYAAPVAQAQHSVPEGVTIERDVAGTIHIKVGDFDFIQLQYQRPYTDNASTWKLAERIASLLAAAPGKEGL
ncbi:hypothetical protein ACM7JP_08295 [Pseudomonas aeruginosa]